MPLWTKIVTNYLQGIKLRNNLHSSSFLLLHLRKTIAQNFTPLVLAESPYFHISRVMAFLPYSEPTWRSSWHEIVEPHWNAPCSKQSIKSYVNFMSSAHHPFKSELDTERSESCGVSVFPHMCCQQMTLVAVFPNNSQYNAGF